jgi:hypothetical protein
MRWIFVVDLYDLKFFVMCVHVQIAQLNQLAAKHTRTFNGNETVNWAIVGTAMSKPWNVCKQQYEQINVTTQSSGPHVAPPLVTSDVERTTSVVTRRFDKQDFSHVGKQLQFWTNEEVQLLYYLVC